METTKERKKLSKKQKIGIIIMIMSFAVLIATALSFILLSAVGVTKDGIRYCMMPVGNGKWAYYVAEIDISEVSSDIKIPNKINSLPVTEISNSAFQTKGDFHEGNREPNSKISSIFIPKSVTYLSSNGYLFGDCTALTSIIIEEGNPVYHSENNCVIETESKTLIAGCMTSIIPEDGSVTAIAPEAFVNCAGLQSITIPSSVNTIGQGAFYNCYNLTAISVPFVGGDKISEPSSYGSSKPYNQLNYIFNRKWNGTFKPLLKEVVVTGGSFIDENAFSGFESITNITLPNSLTSIGNAAFRNCKNLTNLVIPNNVTIIGSSAFDNCQNLNSITLPNSLTKIDTIFTQCINLKSIKYNGTQAQWEQIKKDIRWKENSAIMQIVCSDGTIKF